MDTSIAEDSNLEPEEESKNGEVVQDVIPTKIHSPDVSMDSNCNNETKPDESKADAIEPKEERKDSNPDIKSEVSSL